MQAVGGTALSPDIIDRPSSKSGGRLPADPAVRRRRVIALLAAIALLALATDIITKVVAVANLSGRPPVRLLGGALYFSLIRNTGAAWHLGAGYTAVLAVVAIVVIVVIVRFARRIGSVPWAVALGLVLGGASGNLTDRLFRAPSPLHGGVVDFISLFDPYGQRWPIFNIADSCLVCGVILAVLLELTGRRLDGRRARDERADPAKGVKDGSIEAGSGGAGVGTDGAGPDASGAGSTDPVGAEPAGDDRPADGTGGRRTGGGSVGS